MRITDIPNKRYGMPGNASCPGCPEAMGLRFVEMALGPKTVLVIPAGCSTIIQGIWPKSGISLSVFNIVFGATAAACTGLSLGFKLRGKEDVHVVAWAGDGATADIGFQSLSGAAERNDDVIYICVDNEAYMNTGIQRSSLTPYGAWTTTTWRGKREHKKNLPLIMVDHNIPYVATASVGFPLDFIEKLRKASKIRGFKYIHLHAPCPVGWRFDPSMTVKVAKLAVQTGMWPLFEYENGVFRLSPISRPYKDKSRRKPLSEYVKIQGRFRHLTEEDLARLEEYVDELWHQIDRLERAQGT